MSKKLKIIIAIDGFVLFILLAVLAYNWLSPKVTPDDSNTPIKVIAAPDFTVTATDGSEVALSSMKGKPVILNFWASWCPPCQKEIPDLQK